MPNINWGVLDGVRRISARVRDLVIDGGLPGAPLGYRLRGATQSGAPVTGTWRIGDVVLDRASVTWTCTASGSPGLWASMPANSLSGILPVATGGTGNISGTAVNISSALNSVPVPVGAVSLNSQKITSLANGTAAADAAAFGQVQAAPPYYYMMPTGALAETFPRHTAVDTEALVSGTLYMTAIVLQANQVISNINYLSGNTAAVTPTHWWFSLYNASGTMLATTADQTTTAFAANSKLTLAVATGAGGAITSYTVPSTGMYYVGFCMTATTMPTLLRMATTNATGIAATGPNLCSTSDTGQTGPPAFPHSSFTSQAGAVSSRYAYVS